MKQTIMHTERLAKAIRYTVEKDGKEIFLRVVPFRSDRRHRAGGAAFQEAARAQEAAAMGKS